MSQCTECQRLRGEYLKATFAHARITNKKQIAALRRDHAIVAELDIMEQTALEERRRAGAAYSAHTKTHSAAA